MAAVLQTYSQCIQMHQVRETKAWTPAVVYALSLLLHVSESHVRTYVTSYYAAVARLSEHLLAPEVRRLVAHVLIRTGAVHGLTSPTALRASPLPSAAVP